MSATTLPVLQEGPRRATILVQLDCNARCPFCSTRVYTPEGVLSPVDYKQSIARRAKDYTLSLEELKRVYDGLRADGVASVNLQGGEPTLHPGLVELLRYGHELGFEEQLIVTNGRALKDRTYARALVEAGPRTIALSIFGHTAELHDASMGVRGAFDDLSAAVAGLVELQAEGAQLTLMAQLTLHAEVFEALPQMVRHWFGRGLKDFSIRLLRETENTRVEGTGRWFFDLERLRAPLASALAFAREHDDLQVRFGEVPYCLVEPAHLPFVLQDLGANPSLRARRTQISRHFELEPGAHRRHLPRTFDACEECDLAAACLRPSPPYPELFTGHWRPWHIAETIAGLVAAPLERSRLEEALHLLQTEERLAWFDVPDEHRLALRARAASLLDDDPAGQARVLLGDRGQKELIDRLRKGGGRPVSVRLVAATELGVSGPFDGAAEELLARLEAAVLPDKRATLAFFRQAGLLANEPLVAMVAWRRRAPEGEELALAALYDDRFLERRELERCLATVIAAAALKSTAA